MRRDEFARKYHSAVLVTAFTEGHEFVVHDGYDGKWIRNLHLATRDLIDEFGAEPEPKEVQELLLDCEPEALVTVVDDWYLDQIWVEEAEKEFGSFTGSSEQMDYVIGVILSVMASFGVLIPAVPITIIFQTKRNIYIGKQWIRNLTVKRSASAEQTQMIFGQVRNVKTETALLERVSGFGREQEKYLYSSPIDLYKGTVNDIPGSDRFLLSETVHPWILGFWLNLFDTGDIITALTAAFDYFDFVLRLAVYFLRTKEGVEPKGRLSDLDVQTLAEEIIDKAEREETPDTVSSGVTMLRPEISEHMRKLLDQLERIYGYDIQGKRFNLLGLTGLVRRMRNDMKGHGYMSKETAWYAWELMMHFISILHVMMDTAHFMFSYEGNEGMLVGWDNETWFRGPYYIADEGKPCLAWNCRNNGKIEYINYYSGKYIIPSIIEK